MVATNPKVNLRGITRPSTKWVDPVNPRPRGNHSPITIQNRVRMRVVGPDRRGRIVTKDTTPWYDNILTTYGLASMASAVGSSGAQTASFWIQAIYIGTSSTAPTSTDVSLGASTASITMGNASFTKTNTGNMTVEYQATFASSNTSGAYTINEVGLYCNSTGNETQNHIAAHATLATNVVKGACLSGDTRFLTRNGTPTLREMVDKEVEVLNRFGKWEKATVKSFGIQRLYKMNFRRMNPIYATAEHRWWMLDGTRVNTLKVKRIPFTETQEEVDVVSVEDTGRDEEVFCCVVPGTESFTLANGLITSNSDVVQISYQIIWTTA